MLLLALAAQAAEPFLGPLGWTVLGPFPGEIASARGTAVFDPATCAVEVAQVDLDGGPGFRDVRLARAYVGGRWEWLDDWRVADGVLSRPGRAPRPVAAFRGTLRTDAAGWVTHRSVDGVEVEILRRDAAFVGMRRGSVEVSVDAGEGRAADGRTARYGTEDDRLVSVTAPGGAMTRYGYVDGVLASVTWPDGAVLRVAEDGTRGAGGAWTCRRDGDRALVRGPNRGGWTVQDVPGGQVAFDPTGGETRVALRGETLSSWRDPRRGSWTVTRDAASRPTAIDGPTGARWSLGWGERGLESLADPTGARWSLARDAEGRVVRAASPTGRTTAFVHDPTGALREVRGELGTTVLGRDSAGRVTSLLVPGRGEIRIERDSAGRPAAVTDGGGGRWTLARDAAGAITRVVEPGGGRWELAYDRMGLPREVRDPAGGTLSWSRQPGGALSSFTVAGLGRWEVLRGSSGHASGLRDPLGRPFGWVRDSAGRVASIQRADLVRVAVRRDGAGDVVGLGELAITRDARGLPVGLAAPGGQEIAWSRDAAGAVIGVRAGGIDLAVARAPGGALREVRAGGAVTKLARGPGERVSRAEGAGAVDLGRDPAGQIVAIRGGPSALSVRRGVRGLVDEVRAGDARWTVHRDASGRVLGVEAPGGIAAGVDRDAAGRPVVARFPDGGLARIAHDGLGWDATIVDADGGVGLHVGWARDASGELVSRTAGTTWGLKRDPAGQLAVAEAGAEFWSATPDGAEGPGGWRVSWDEQGRARSARFGLDAPGAWQLPPEELRYALGPGGRVDAIQAESGAVALAYDAAGRLVRYAGPGGEVAIERDALGIVRRVGDAVVDGALGMLLRVDGAPRAMVPRVLVGFAGGGLVLDALGGPLAGEHTGASPVSPTGLPLGPTASEIGAGGRLHLAAGGPMLGLLDAIDPLTGQDLGPGLLLPWLSPAWEVREAAEPWPSPDGASRPWWDPAPWHPRSTWWDPLAVLAEAGEFPRLAAARGAPGLPWLPASMAPLEPALGAPAWPAGEDPVAEFVLRAAVLARAPAADELGAWLLAAEVAAEFPGLPGLAPPLPPALRDAEDRLAEREPGAL